METPLKRGFYPLAWRIATSPRCQIGWSGPFSRDNSARRLERWGLLHYHERHTQDVRMKPLAVVRELLDQRLREVSDEPFQAARRVDDLMVPGMPRNAAWHGNGQV